MHTHDDEKKQKKKKKLGMGTLYKWATIKATYTGRYSCYVHFSPYLANVNVLYI